jgi:hypothetical protein
MGGTNRPQCMFDVWSEINSKKDDLKLQHFSFETLLLRLCDPSNLVTLIICLSLCDEETKWH